jgi:hypothetical protein
MRASLKLMRRAAHELEDARAGVLEGDIQVGQDFAVRHQRDDAVHVRIGIDVVQPHPHAERAQRLAQGLQVAAQQLPFPGVVLVVQVGAVGAGVLRDHQQLLHAGRDQALGLAHDLAELAAGQLAAHRGDDAEAALVVAALGNLQVRVMPRRQLDALRRHQVQERVVRRRQVLVHRRHHLLVALRPCGLQHLRVLRADEIGFGRAQAAGDDDLAVLRHRLADGVQRFMDGGIDEAAGVHHHEVGVLVGRRDLVTLDLELGQDALGIHQRLGTAEADEADLGRARGRVAGNRGGHDSHTANEAAYSTRRPGAVQKTSSHGLGLAGRA